VVSAAEADDAEQVKESSNKPDAANPAIALWLTIADQWRRVADLERWARHS
jgi:hypothetical protein